MKTISRYIMTLALLITAVGGAWADEEVLLTTITPTSHTTYSQSPDGIVTVTLDNIESYSSAWGWCDRGIVTVEAAQGYTITRCVFKQNPDFTPNRVLVDDQAPFTATMVEVNGGEEYYVSVATSTGEVRGADFMNGISIIEVYGTAEPGIEVTTDAASEQDLFTEASFTMPAFDATAEYELVRDMSIQMTATMGDGTDGVRYRVKKAQQGQGYEPADMDMTQVLALVAVNDGIEQQALTLDQDYFCRIYKLDEQTLQPEGDGVKLSEFDFAPGLYALKAFAQNGSDYAGETALSNTFKLFQGYEVEVAAQSFATYYSDEALTLDETFAETAGLYTITEVNATEAVLSEKIDVMPKRTPMLIYNESETLQTVLLIPTADVAPLTDVADEFKGTAVEKTVSADEVAATNFYVLTDQNQFVWVKDAGTIAAHRCWLEIAPSQAAGARRIVFSGSGTTGIDAATLRDITTGDWYDLNGRKLNGIPTKRGIYIQNGKKVVVR